MNRKLLIALAAAATLSVGFASAAKADPHISIGFGFGGYDSGYGYGGYGGGYGYPGSGFYHAGYNDDCGFAWVKTKHWNWNHTYKVVSMKKKWVCY